MSTYRKRKHKTGALVIDLHRYVVERQEYFQMIWEAGMETHPHLDWAGMILAEEKDLSQAFKQMFYESLRKRAG